MSRLLLGAAIGAVVAIATTTALGLHAQSIAPTPEVEAKAKAVGVDPVDLLGAMITTGYDADTYLCLVGEGPCPQPPAPPPIIGALARADCIIGKESGGRDVPNRQGSGASGPGQYFGRTWERHTALYRAATGYAGPLSLHSLRDVRRVMAWILAAIPSTRREWSVGGC